MALIFFFNICDKKKGEHISAEVGRMFSWHGVGPNMGLCLVHNALALYFYHI